MFDMNFLPQSNYATKMPFFLVFHVSIILHVRLNLCSENGDSERRVYCEITTKRVCCPRR